ncbi:ribosomal protein L2 [Candidatus Carsonella ruddii HT isolate Thao2000]|uniref:Large ribosomal subunit protein uL2 n=1 Tax=Candidatus Carsonella ruddii HT isolate Thao2000 TaxID=1202539 RepID=J3TWE0_CARRU|nr:50S ribosomal protein L2 [Candidatus Carsonella ruddii]AFP84200.1 ribosomal protein L2 [Candidatus Carsonella ruddii HT isolate Thao2000]
MNNNFLHIKKHSGRSHGKISVRHKGGSHKKIYIKVDFFRKKNDILAKIVKFVYDPYRNVKLALLNYNDGEKKYIIKTNEIKINSYIISSKNNINLINGNNTLLKNINIGSTINCIEKFPNSGAIFARSSGVCGQLLFKNNNFAIIKLPSSKKIKLSLNCKATIGKIFNENRKKYYKAGQKRWKGIRPTVRGVAMNPVDHPLGGGEGKTSGGRHPCSPFGQKSKGLKTKK